jgi:hypothetical protein
MLWAMHWDVEIQGFSYPPRLATIQNYTIYVHYMIWSLRMMSFSNEHLHQPIAISFWTISWMVGTRCPQTTTESLTFWFTTSTVYKCAIFNGYNACQSLQCHILYSQQSFHEQCHGWLEQDAHIVSQIRESGRIKCRNDLYCSNASRVWICEGVSYILVLHRRRTGSKLDTPATAPAIPVRTTPPATTLRIKLRRESETPGWAASAISGTTAAARSANPERPTTLCSFAGRLHNHHQQGIAVRTTLLNFYFGNGRGCMKFWQVMHT